MQKKAKSGTLPANFNKWDIRGGYFNETISHIAASVGYPFPIDFPGLEWVDNNGKTVRQVYEEYLAKYTK